MKAEIITIGDELLIGQVVDSNSAWMSQQLNGHGFQVVRKTTTGDDEDAIIAAIEAARSTVPLVLVTGGLGPTRDDITLRTLCRYFGAQLHFSEEVYTDMERLFRQRGRVMNELTRLQAMVPDECTVIRNQAGTAPCTWFERDGSVLVSMPGVPSEMKWLMTHEVLPRLAQRFHRDLHILHHTCLVRDYSESELALHLSGFEDRLPSLVKLAYLPQAGIIRLRLSAYGTDGKEATAAIALCRAQLESLLEGHLLAVEDQGTEVLLGDCLRARRCTVGTAESCTGGSIAALLTSVAGSSDYFAGSVVAYANAVKRQVLGVSEHDLQQHGAVSREVVEQMARGALHVLGCDYAVATSGIAGPGGGTPEKPVGTIWVAVADKDAVVSACYRFGTVREQNVQRTVQTALLMLLDRVRK
ncbi:MAG: CinA family nicotinamide mononucleotide deamidase-related protein [Tannerella sp.]|jgi:nicotinamide-nucleotide amidase|nr:CinA family nicotinamide mononucleotide deamidase-related protein [Tannerella sp.]